MKYPDSSAGRIYGNASDEQYRLIPLHSTPKNAKKHYLLNEIYRNAQKHRRDKKNMEQS